MQKIGNILCIIELSLFVMVPMAAWLASVLGADVVNLVSEEALRWFFRHAGEVLVSYPLSLIIMVVITMGAFIESGMTGAIREAKSHKKALLISGGTCFVILILLLLPTIIPQNPLMSITGSLIPSPWLNGFPYFLCIDVIISSILFASVEKRLGGILGISRFLSVGIQKYGIWIVNAMMANMIYSLIQFAF